MVTRFEKRKQLRNRKTRFQREAEEMKKNRQRMQEIKGSFSKMTDQEKLKKLRSLEIPKGAVSDKELSRLLSIKRKRGGGIKTKSDKEFDAHKKNLKFMKKQQEEKRLREQMNKDKKRLQEKKLGIAVKRGGIAKLPKGLQAYIKRKKK